MEQVKKKIAQLKIECDDAKSQLEDANRQKKEADERADTVSKYRFNNLRACIIRTIDHNRPIWRYNLYRES